MLGQATITLNLGTVADPENKVLNRINQDGYSTEYYLKDTDRDHRLFVRHNTEKQAQRGLKVDRHNVLYRQEFYPTEFAPQGEIIEAYSVIRVSPTQPASGSTPLINAVSNLLADEADAIVGWQS